MEELLKAMLLGLVQGVTEFLPVSSKGHLIIAKDLLSMPEQGLLWGVCLHVATVVSTVVVFWREIVNLIRGFFNGAALTIRTGSLRESTTRDPRFALVLLYIISAIPVGIAGLYFKKPLEQLFSDAMLTACMLGVTGSLLWMTRSRRDPETGKPVGLGSAILMGLAQAVALIPGISRSGSTMSTGILSGAKASDVARFSFLMVVPPVLAAALLEAKDLHHAGGLHGVPLGPLAVGFVVAAVVGYFALRWLLPIVRQGKLYRFAYYCWAVGGLVILWKGAQMLAGR